ncbi:protein DpdE [Herbaspirillum sp.]|uniref:protein DpdE n=1 Tax=Herbaspirillum sp. TaxID=1890675 RepID=UPI0031DFD0E4
MFCLIKGYERDGFGKVIRSDAAKCTVEFFDSPTGDGRHIREVHKTLVVPKKLGRNTRVYAYNELDNRWRVGRVIEDDGEGLLVRFAHKDDAFLPYDSAFVRWKKPIQNPVVYLANCITETPQYAEARSEYLRCYTEQRGVAFGIKSLLSSSVELESHQIDVARRVLNDPSQRYLLADEVGLGKTIEAGMIIRQAVLDDPVGHRIVVLVPVTLVKQWRMELVRRFGLRTFIDESVFVLAHDAGPEQKEMLDGATMLVIDEAHHVADPNAEPRIQKLYELARRAALKIERLLLLSATPILRNEAGFLRMLHLLDPVVYPLDDYERFHIKIENRQSLAEVVSMLVPANAYYLDPVLDDLVARIPDDTRLRELVSELKDHLVDLPDGDDPDVAAGIRQLRAHISETYRLNRRILRNRRRQISGLTPDRGGAMKWFVADSPMSRLESALEEWRIAACASLGDNKSPAYKQALRDFYWSLISAYMEEPGKVQQLCMQRDALASNTAEDGVTLFEGEQELLKRIKFFCDEDQWLDARLTQLTTGIRSLPSNTKAVVFCSSTDVANDVFAHLKACHINPVRHETDPDADFDLDKPEAWDGFLVEPNVKIIVCDHRAEEGINLQGGNKSIIHFDMPIQPNRIEQRIGRVDRYGTGSQVQSIVMVDQHARLQAAWFNVLDEGWRVFKQSISSLQYLVEDELGRLRDAIFLSGAEAMDELNLRIAGPDGLAAKELKLIDQQDALDELSPLLESETDEIFDLDADWKSIRRSMLYWIAETLLFEVAAIKQNTGTTPPLDQPFRLHYHPPESTNAAPTLIPIAGFLDDFLGAIDYGAPGSRANEPRSYIHATHRATAVKRGIRPLRYGDEFIEAVMSFSDIDDRGRSFAMWRQIHESFERDELKMCFRFDFVVEARLSDAEKALADYESKGAMQLSRAALARRGDALLRPFIIHVWLDEDGQELAPDFVDQYLSGKYAKDGTPNYVDKNLGGEHFRGLKKMAPDTFANWHERCLRMHDFARQIVLARADLAEKKGNALKQARIEDEIRYAQLRTRIQSLSGREAVAERAQFDLEESLNEALYRGIIDPIVKVDVAGVCFLTSAPVSVLERFVGNA